MDLLELKKSRPQEIENEDRRNINKKHQTDGRPKGKYSSGHDGKHFSTNSLPIAGSDS